MQYTPSLQVAGALERGNLHPPASAAPIFSPDQTRDVTVQVDGVYLARPPPARGLSGRGPCRDPSRATGTLYGRNASAERLQRISRQPTDDFAAGMRSPPGLRSAADPAYASGLWCRTPEASPRGQLHPSRWLTSRISPRVARYRAANRGSARGSCARAFRADRRDDTGRLVSSGNISKVYSTCCALAQADARAARQLNLGQLSQGALISSTRPAMRRRCPEELDVELTAAGH